MTGMMNSLNVHEDFASFKQFHAHVKSFQMSIFTEGNSWPSCLGISIIKAILTGTVLLEKTLQLELCMWVCVWMVYTVWGWRQMHVLLWVVSAKLPGFWSIIRQISATYHGKGLGIFMFFSDGSYQKNRYQSPITSHIFKAVFSCSCKQQVYWEKCF